jgi:glycosyltransferase involved in cell wall biosynthesis
MFVHELLASEVGAFPELQTAHHRRSLQLEAGRADRRRREWNLADVVIVASRFTRDSFARRGRDVSRVRVVPLGAPPPCSGDPGSSPTTGTSRLSLIWAGTFSIRKGAHHLLAAWRNGRLGRHATLRIYGSVALPDRVLQPLPEGIEFMGPVPRSQLMEAYGTADALVFPTLCDGFGMVATEAWSRGLPVITTDRAGCADLLRPGENGLLVRAGDPLHLQEVLADCAARPDQLRAMRASALETAASWQWADYRAELGRVLRESLTP